MVDRVISKEDFVNDILRTMKSKDYKEATNNLVNKLSDYLGVVPPKKIKYESEYIESALYNCVTNTVHISNEKLFNKKVRETGHEEAVIEIIQDTIHELWHHAVCVGRKDPDYDLVVNWDKEGLEVSLPITSAEEVGAEFLENSIERMIRSTKTNKRY